VVHAYGIQDCLSASGDTTRIRLRHTIAHRRLESGRRLEALRHVLGHSTNVMTQCYARLGDEYVRREAEPRAGEVATELVAKASQPFRRSVDPSGS